MSTLLINKILDFNPNALGTAFFMGYGGILVLLIVGFLIMGIYVQNMIVKALSFLFVAGCIYEVVQLMIMAQ